LLALLPFSVAMLFQSMAEVIGYFSSPQKRLEWSDGERFCKLFLMEFFSLCRHCNAYFAVHRADTNLFIMEAAGARFYLTISALSAFK
jgi:hypothetical protein